MDNGLILTPCVGLKAEDGVIVNPERLEITNATLYDSGQYTCVVGSSLGLTSASAWLTVLTGRSLTEYFVHLSAE